MTKDYGSSPETYAIPVQPILDNLFSDILVHIFSFLHPTDIIAVRQTSKALWITSHERIVWIEALRRVCAYHGIFAPTFPMIDMSTTQLERAATSPVRFLARLRRELPWGSIKPTCVRTLTQSSEMLFEGTYLVPGGRFLFTRSHNLIELWDLGFSSDSTIGSQPVASMLCQLAGAFMIGLQPTRDGSGISLMLETVPLSTANDTIQYQAFEVFPSSSTPAFRPVGSLSFGPRGFPVCFSGDLLVIISDGIVTVWNAAQDSWARWQTGIIGEDVRQIQCCKCDGNLVFMSNNVITVWEIPPLVDCASNTHLPVDIRRPLFRHIHRDPSEHEESLLVAQIGWKPAVSSKMHPFHFDVLYAQYDGHSALDHHILHPIDNDANEGLPSCFPTFIGTTPTLGPVSPGQTVYAKSAWMNSCESLFVWTENRNVIVILSTLPSAKDLPNRRSVGTIWTSEPGMEPDPEVCPFSGRVCILDRQWSMDNKITIIDL